MSLLAQALDSTPIEMPEVDWVSLSPILVLIGGAMLLLLVHSIVRWRLPRGTYAVYTIVVCAVAAGACVPLWDRVRDGRARPVIANAVNMDGFAIFIAVLTCAAIALAALILDDYLRREAMEGPEVYVLMLLSGSGGVIMAASNDLIVLFLGLEVLSIALYILAGSHVRRVESQEAAIKYFVLGAMSSAVLLYGIALIYGATGTTNLTEVASYLSGTIVFENLLLLGGIVLLLVGLGFKIAAVPFHMWTPDVYQGSPSPVTGFMAAAAKAAGFAGLLRVFMTALASQRLDWQPLVWALAVITMIVGSVLAVVQTDIKRMLGYSSIAHAGYILIGLQAASDNGVAGSLFYLLAYTFIVLGSFAVVTVVGRRGDAEHSLDSYRGLARRRPVMALLFTTLLLAQAGAPLTSGFVAKFGVIQAAVEVHSYAIAIIAMLTAVIAAFFYLRVIVQMYMTDPVDASAGAGAPALPVPLGAWITLGVAVAFTLFAGIIPQYLIDFARDAGLS